MNLKFNASDIFSVAILSLLITLLIHHFFIYYGRKGKDRSYYINFTLFALSFAIYLLCVTGLQKYIFPSVEVKEAVSPTIKGITYFFLLDFARKMFNIILDLPKEKKIFRPYFISFLIYGLLVSTNLMLDFHVYLRYIFPFVLIFATFCPLYMFIVFTQHVRKHKPGDTTLKFILACFFVFMLDFALEEIPSALGFYYPLKGSYFISGLSALLWAFILAARFNSENRELRALKLSLETKVLERTKELEHAIGQRTNTFINLAHEVRTPLTLISNYIDEQIKNHGSTREIRIIKENTEKLVKDISNFFTEEKFLQCGITFDHSGIINLSEFISTKVSLFSPYVEKKEQSIVTSVKPRIFIKADPAALESLVNNLLENAIRYTPNGGTIVVKLSTKDEKIRLVFRDNGIGIPAEAMKKIFEPYYQVTEKKLNSSGIGMGLSIVNKIVNSLGGSVAVRSRVGLGTIFMIELPLHKLISGEKANHYVHPEPVMNSHVKVCDAIDPEKKHAVLIVEDNLQLLQFLTDKLKDHLNVYIAEDGRKAFEKLLGIPRPALIISDIMMDNMDGYAFYDKLVCHGFNTIPFIFLTAKNNNNEKLKGLQMGAVDFICKPFKVDELVSKAISIVNRSEQHKNELVSSVSKFLNNLVETTSPESRVEESSFDYNCYSFNISAREKEIINYTSLGYSTKEISDMLNISEHTVAKHLQNIFKKTGSNNKLELLTKITTPPCSA